MHTRNSSNTDRANPAGSEPETVEVEALDPSAAIRASLGKHNIVLVGMMGAGKTSVGRRLAATLGLPFVDADTEIEAAANQTIPEIFERYGEAHFRDGERRVIARLLKKGPQVIATGGGAVMSKRTRAAIKKHSVSIWLKAEPDVLMERVRRKSNRPLLRQADPEGTLHRLLAERAPVYGTADLTVQSRDAPHGEVVDTAIAKLAAFLNREPASC
ncbi:MAG: shikimate kinase [Alphaproteobacteria bacterium]